MDSDPGYFKVKNLIESINDEELEGNGVYAAFAANKGFTRVYKIFYIVDGTLMEGHISYNLLHRRSYIISFGRVGY